MKNLSLLLFLVCLVTWSAPGFVFGCKGEGDHAHDDDQADSETIKAEDGVLVLTKDNFEEATTGTTILVEFYAPWCQYCKNLAPELIKLASQLTIEQPTWFVGKVDATVETELSNKYNIRAFPTFIFFLNGQVYQSTGNLQTAEKMLTWMHRKVGPPAVELLSVQSFIASDQVVLLGFFTSKRSEDAAVFLQVANQLNDQFPFALSTDPKIGKSIALEGEEGVVLYKKFDEGRVEFGVVYPEEVGLTVENLNRFISVYSMPVVLNYRDEKYQEKLFESEIKWIVFLLADYLSPDYFKVREAFRSVASDFRGQAFFVTADVSDPEEAKYLLPAVGALLEDAPVLRVLNMTDGNKPTKFAPEEEDTDLSVGSISRFVTRVLAGEAKQYYASQKLPEDWDQGPVKVLVGRNFDQVTLDPSKDVLVEFYAPWCGACAKLAPVYEQLGEMYRGSEDQVVIAKMDATANELEHTPIGRYPTIKLYKAGSNDVVDFDTKVGATLENLGLFVGSHGEYVFPKKEIEEKESEEEEAEKEEPEKEKEPKKEEL